jgi:hypothetical protein
MSIETAQVLSAEVGCKPMDFHEAGNAGWDPAPADKSYLRVELLTTTRLNMCDMYYGMYESVRSLHLPLPRGKGVNAYGAKTAV